MKRDDLLTTEEGVQLLLTKWEEYLKVGNKALDIVTNFNNELTAYLAEQKPLSNRSIGCQKGFRRVNIFMGIYTNDLHKHIKKLNAGLTPNYPLSYIPKLQDIDKKAQKWKKDYIEAVNIYKDLKERYRLSFYNSDGTFDFANWL